MRRFAGLLATFATLALAGSAQGAVVGFGINDAGQIGAGFASRRPLLSPETSLLPSSTVELVAGEAGFVLARQADGTVLSWGNDYSDSLGNGVKRNSAVPSPIPGLSHVVEVASGGEHGLARLEDGTVVEWGAFLFGDGNGYSALGNEAKVHLIPRPVVVNGLRAARIFAGGGNAGAILPDGGVVCWGEAPICGGVERTTPTEIPGLTGAVEVRIDGEGSLGGHGAARFPDGTVKAWGSDQYGQTGNGSLAVLTATPTVVPGVIAKSLAVGPWHTLALTPSGDVLAWGQNGEDQLGVKPGAPVCGRGRKRPCSTVPITVLHGASAIAAHLDSFALVGGKLMAWGRNTDGELGNGTRTASPTPVAANVNGATSLTVGSHYALVSILGAGPPPSVEVTPGHGSLTVLWRAKAGGEGWTITERPVTKPAGKWVDAAKLLASARSYTLSGLATGTTYQVQVSNKAFGTRGVTGVPR